MSSTGDASPDGKGTLELCRGIEVGHIFQLRTKYSEGAATSPSSTRPGKAQIMEMGCYGIGVSRIVAAAIEQNHDERGIIFPRAIAPFEVAIVPIGYNKSALVTGSRGPAVCRTHWPQASMCCSTTATSVPASCSPTWN